jgi:hypothetical protein
MFCLNNKPLFNQELSKYLLESTNKSMKKYLNMNYLQGQTNDSNENPSNYILLPFVSLFSFLAGYYFKSIKNQL